MRLSSAIDGADPRAAGEVDDRGRRAPQRLVVVAAGELAGDARQPRAEGERLDAAPRGDRRVEVLHHRRAYGVIEPDTSSDEHDGAVLDRRPAPAALERLPAVAQRGPQRPAQVGAVRAAARGPHPPRAPRRAAEGEAREDPVGRRELLVGHVREVLAAQQLDVAVGGGDGLGLLVGLRAGPVRRHGVPRERLADSSPSSSSGLGARGTSPVPNTSTKASSNASRSS